jgi:hypothetical protein
MGYPTRAAAGLKHTPSLGSIDVSSTSNASAGITVPSGLTVALLQAQALSEYLGPAEAWLCLGMSYVITTTIATGTPVVSITKGGTAITGATMTLPTAANATTILFAPVASYARPTIAAADVMGLKISTTNSATGVINPTYIWYTPIAVAGVSDAVSTV